MPCSLTPECQPTHPPIASRPMLSSVFFRTSTSLIVIFEAQSLYPFGLRPNSLPYLRLIPVVTFRDPRFGTERVGALYSGCFFMQLVYVRFLAHKKYLYLYVNLFRVINLNNLSRGGAVVSSSG